jgi:hypothetical protein
MKYIPISSSKVKVKYNFISKNIFISSSKVKVKVKYNFISSSKVKVKIKYTSNLFIDEIYIDLQFKSKL